MTFNDAIELARLELARAQVKFPGFHSGHEGYAVIREELEELWDAVKRDDTTAQGFEAVQVAAMALRFLVDLCAREDVLAYTKGRIGKTLLPTLFAEEG